MHTRIAVFAAGLVSLLWGFQAMLLSHAPSAFRAPEEDMSFAWYVPLFSIYVLWTERAKIAKSLGAPSLVGFAAMMPFLALGFLGARGVQLRFEIVAFSGLAVCWMWTVFGRRAAASVLFPSMFLLFCIPLATFLDVVTVHLRLFATGCAYASLKAFGIEAVRQGTMLSTSGGFSIDVAEPCSGLRSIFALMALTAAYAYFNQPTWLRRAVLFACSVPLAVIGNVMRILSICVVAECADGEFAQGFYHDYSGYVVFIVAIALMVACGEAISKVSAAIARRRGADSGESSAAEGPGAECGRAARAGGFGAAVPFVALAVLVFAMVYQATTPKVVVADPPRGHLAEIAGYESVELGPGEAELNVLPKDTVIEKRRYCSDDGDWFVVTLVIGGTSKSSIHRPELCLPAQGYLMVSPRTVNVDGVSWRLIDLKSGGSASMGFAYTFFNQTGFRTSSHVSRIFRDVWDRSVLNRIDRWAMVTVASSRADEGAMRRFVSNLAGVIAE